MSKEEIALQLTLKAIEANLIRIDTDQLAKSVSDYYNAILEGISSSGDKPQVK